MNEITLNAQPTLAEACTADAVIIESGIQARAIAKNFDLMAQLQLDPKRQLVGAQCSGTLLLAKLGLLDRAPGCTDLITKPWVEEADIKALNQAFSAQGNIATAGGCFASQYLAAWIIARFEGEEAAKKRASPRCTGWRKRRIRLSRNAKYHALSTARVTK